MSLCMFSHFLLAFLPSSVTIILTARKSPGGLGDTRYKDIGNGNLLGVLFFPLFLFFSYWEFASTSGKLSWKGGSKPLYIYLYCHVALSIILILNQTMTPNNETKPKPLEVLSLRLRHISSCPQPWFTWRSLETADLYGQVSDCWEGVVLRHDKHPPLL
ncbi:hypothetical protein B0J15DRAFT_132621 [Fusarium solani]|uniref:Uncharacterized protein n=1 Tax=Fusarium solani TaxID=169388 RepID=A0A9P9RDH3_FUSSL|nr:uncharacterized protein B0J15DRAFT_132621 [Fusarium solani]KAH7274523.1 hypothetical protein B0J15DRAFT_132621 [Fusarium solani]